MSGRLPLAIGVATSSVAAIVLVTWALGHGEAPRLIAGWRVIVPSTAFGFLCAGVGLIIASASPDDADLARSSIRMLAATMVVLPIATLLEYSTGSRWGVEYWLGAPIPNADVNPYAGRMSAMTSMTFVLLATALAGLTSTARWALATVQIAGGAALAVSWFAVLALSFDPVRISNQPRFPGMAALTVVLFAVASYGVLAASRDVVARVRDAGADVALHGGLVSSAFALPLILGPLTAVSSRWLAAEVATALAAVTLAVALTVVVWRGLARMQDLQQQRRGVLAELEERVVARTSELAHTNAQLRQGEDRLLEASRHKDEFLAMLSHELRNPLAPIRTGVQLLKSTDTTPAMRADVHRVVERQMTHLVRLIDDLLDVSRITAGKLTLRLEPIDLREVVEQAIDSTIPLVERAQHQLRVAVPPTPAVVQGDRIRMAQVVVNLIENACKYTPRGGELALELVNADSSVELRMRDNGIGIPASFLPRVFGKFEQLAPMSQESRGGMGIGLALVHGIVSLHGGTVKAASGGPRTGSEFIVRLPRPEAVDTTTAVTPAPEPPAAQIAVPRRVLVVDDNADNTAALSMLLGQLGHDVRVASDGEAALETARQFRPEVVLLDIGIPKVNGYEVCRQLRRFEWGQTIRVIAQTGFGDEEDLRRSADAGFDAHLVKPIDPARLGAVLQA